jgi:hypothetical protein
MLFSKRIKSLLLSATVLTAFAGQAQETVDFPNLQNVTITPEYRPVLKQVETMMSMGGGKVVRMPDGSVWVVGIGMASATGGDGSESDQIETAKMQAQKAVVEALANIHVKVQESDREHTRTVSENGNEQSLAITQLDTHITTEAARDVRRLETAGTWKSDNLRFVAIGKRLRAAGDFSNRPKVISLTSLSMASGVMTPAIAAILESSPAKAEDRFKGALLSTLGSTLSASKEVQLAVRDESLRRLEKEWETADAFGGGKSEAAGSEQTVQEARYLAIMTVQDLTIVEAAHTQGVAGSAVRWNLSARVSCELLDAVDGSKQVFEEDVKGSTTKVIRQNSRRFAPTGPIAMDANNLRSFADAISKKVAASIFDRTTKKQ